MLFRGKGHTTHRFEHIGHPYSEESGNFGSVVFGGGRINRLTRGKPPRTRTNENLRERRDCENQQQT